MPRKPKIFIALKPIWHSVEDREIKPGEVVDLSHCDGQTIEILLETGTVKYAAPEPEHPEGEVTNG